MGSNDLGSVKTCDADEPGGYIYIYIYIYMVSMSQVSCLGMLLNIPLQSGHLDWIQSYSVTAAATYARRERAGPSGRKAPAWEIDFAGFLLLKLGALTHPQLSRSPSWGSSLFLQRLLHGVSLGQFRCQPTQADNSKLR